MVHPKGPRRDKSQESVVGITYSRASTSWQRPSCFVFTASKHSKSQPNRCHVSIFSKSQNIKWICRSAISHIRILLVCPIAIHRDSHRLLDVAWCCLYITALRVKKLLRHIGSPCEDVQSCFVVTWARKVDSNSLYFATLCYFANFCLRSLENHFDCVDSVFCVSVPSCLWLLFKGCSRKAPTHFASFHSHDARMLGLGKVHKEFA